MALVSTVRVLAIAFLLSFFAQQLWAEEEKNFTVETVSGRCTNCDDDYELGRVQFVSRNEAWASASHFAPPGGQGYGTTTVLHTTDGGHTWTQLRNVLQSGAEWGTQFSFVDRLKGWISWMSQEGGVHNIRTSDGGQHWEELGGPSLDYLHFFNSRLGCGIEFAGPGKKRLFATTSDGGKKWVRRAILPLEQPCDAMFFVSPRIGWVAATAKNNMTRVLRTVDGGSTWIGASVAPGSPHDLFFVDSERGWVVIREGINGANKLFHTADGGNKWTRFPEERIVLEPNEYVSRVRFLSKRTGFAFLEDALPGRGRVAYTNDDGRFWTALAEVPAVRDCQVFEGGLRCSAENFEVVTVRPKK